MGEWGHAPTQAVLLSDNILLYKGAQDTQLCQRMIWFGNCYEDKLWERDVCSGSKQQQAQPESKPAVPKSVLMQHSPQEGMREKMPPSESATEMRTAWLLT